MEDLIVHVSEILGDLHGKRPPALSIKSITPPSTHQSLHEQPLPIPPPEESPSGVDYGSAFTKVMTLPPRSSAPSSAGREKEREAEPRTSTSTSREQDFTPTLPSRPTPSIHPSRRAGTSASVRSETSASIAPNTPHSPATAASFEDNDNEVDAPEDHAYGELGSSPLSDYASAYASLQSAGATPATEWTEQDTVMMVKPGAPGAQHHQSSDSSQSTASANTVVPSDGR